MVDKKAAMAIADKITKRYETCARRRPDGLYEAYCDPYSVLGKALQKAGLWQKYITGKVEIPANLAGLSGAPWTIGWGSTGRDVFKGVVWTQAQCDARHARNLEEVMQAILAHLVKREPTAHQLGAMMSMAYNVGLDIDEDDKAEGLGDSTLLKKFNRGDIQGAADAFMSWVYAGGVKSNGLIDRRGTERRVFLGGSP